MSGAKRPSLRTFFALWPGPALRDEIARLAGRTAKDTSGRPPRPETTHLTLTFIGATPVERVPGLQQLMDGIRVPPFTLQLDRCGWWRHNGVVWAGTAAPPEPLLELQQALGRGAEKLGFSLDVRPYVPHLSLARDATRGPLSTAMPELAWKVDSFALVASELAAGGPRYRILHECALTTTPALPASTAH